MEEHLFGKPIPVFDGIGRIIWKLAGAAIVKTAYARRLEQRFEILYPNKRKEEVVRQYLCYKISLLLVILCAAIVCSLVLRSQENSQSQVVDTIPRDAYWGSEKEEQLLVELEGMEGANEMTIAVPERKYNEDEVEQVLQEMGSTLEKTILKENKSLDCVSSNLDLVTQIPDTQVEVSWSMDTDLYMTVQGTLIPEAITQDGVVVNLTASLSYGKSHCVHSFAVCLKKPQLTEKEQMIEEIKSKIDACNVSQAGAENLTLPDTVQGRQVTFLQKEDTYSGKLFAALLLCGVLVFFVKDEHLQKELDKRKKQMMLDYSEIVSKLTLLLGAGMTVRMALEKIASDYNKKQNGRAKHRYAYDEILYVCREMQGGVSERAGIDMLSNRCQIPCYMKLCSLLLQNLKKGSKGMAQSLSYEVGQAFEEQKNVARKMGEEAGTKLLLPMILMLVIVMVTLIVPAFLSF